MKGIMEMFTLKILFNDSDAYRLLNICAGRDNRNTTERGGANCVRSDN